MMDNVRGTYDITINGIDYDVTFHPIKKEIHIQAPIGKYGNLEFGHIDFDEISVLRNNEGSIDVLGDALDEVKDMILNDQVEFLNEYGD